MSDRTDYVRGQVAFLRDILPKASGVAQRARIVWVVVSLIGRRLTSPASTQVEWDAAEAAGCPCEDDLPAVFRCMACPRRLLG